MDDFKKKMNKICSVGGVKCPCCNPYSGKDKKKLNRQARAGLKQETLKEITENLNFTLYEMYSVCNSGNRWIVTFYFENEVIDNVIFFYDEEELLKFEQWCVENNIKKIYSWRIV